MSKIRLAELLQQDIENLKELFEYYENDLTKKAIKRQARDIILNLQDHLEELIQLK